MAKRTHALEKDAVGDSALWRQWTQRHTPKPVRLLPATEDDMLFETGPSTPDDRYDQRMDKQQWLRSAPEYYSITPRAAQEAYWITRYEQAGEQFADNYRAKLESEGYLLTAAEYIEAHLTREDVEMWHSGEGITPHTEQVFDDAGVDRTRQIVHIWGSHDGPEPLNVQIVEK